ncbi:hypothetical protein [Deinococcus hohokamensis]|uniref:Serine/threonine protein kinase n=1 Tax=Deinococcus hohokamensis TaxID=309883 RepID=A0ABV9I4V9_9DEIO
MRRARLALLGGGLLALVAGAGLWQSREARWQGPLYCLQAPGQVWAAAPVPSGVTPVCPASHTVRAEVRRGETRIEQYELPGWQPAPVLGALTAAGYRVVSRIPDDGVQEAAVLSRGRERLTYVADRMNGQTLVSLTTRGGP